MVTGRGKRACNAVSRYCVWFGTLTAVVAGVLGWFLGGFRLTDASWVKMAHRWLGTATVAGAGLVLVLSERSRHPDRQRTRMWFRVTLFLVTVLVSATGFLGGALVFGLDHYHWPQSSPLCSSDKKGSRADPDRTEATTTR
jgi:heme A synthase